MEHKILVPLDGSALSERAIEPAEKIARAIGCEMVLFRVIDTPLETTLEAEPEEERRAASASIEKATTYLKGIASRIEGKGIKTRIEVMADKEDVEFIIMSTHGRTGLSRALMGSVAEDSQDPDQGRESDPERTRLKPFPSARPSHGAGLFLFPPPARNLPHKRII
jgi:nucleotide-binding universal stress UspA family protein